MTDIEIPVFSRPGFADDLVRGMVFSLTATTSSNGFLSPAGDQITAESVRKVGSKVLVVGWTADGQPTVRDLDQLRTVLIHSGPFVGHFEPDSVAVLIDVIADLRGLAPAPAGQLADRIVTLADRYADRIAHA